MLHNLFVASYFCSSTDNEKKYSHALRQRRRSDSRVPSDEGSCLTDRRTFILLYINYNTVFCFIYSKQEQPRVNQDLQDWFTKLRNDI